MKHLFELEQAGVQFGPVPALVGVDLIIPAGQKVALVGANGSGKSTLLRLLHGLIAPSTGTITRQSGIRQAMLFQRPHMMRTTALNNVALGLWLAGRPWADARERALYALEQMGLQSLAQRQARNLSGGQQQRLALARAMSLGPEVLLLDEPTASLDPHAKREVESAMADFAAGVEQRALTMVFCSHNLGQVKRLASRVIYLEQGRVMADLPVDDFFNGPLPEPARLFVKGELP